MNTAERRLSMILTSEAPALLISRRLAILMLEVLGANLLANAIQVIAG